jgi:hypothetical protein
MALSQRSPGNTILAADHNEIYNLLKTTTAKETINAFHYGANIASASALTPGTDGNYFHVTGTTTITSIATANAGTLLVLEFDGALTLTHNGTSLILQGAVNYTTVAGDVFTFLSEGAGNWREVGRKTNASLSKQSGIGTRTNGDLTLTAGAAYADITDVTTTLTLPTGTSGKVLVIATIEWSGTAGSSVFFEIFADGVAKLEKVDITSSTGGHRSFSMAWLATGLAAGARIFKLQGKATTTDATVYGGTTAIRTTSISAVEV